MQIDCYGSAQYKLSWRSLEPLVKIKTISTAGGEGGTPYNGLSRGGGSTQEGYLSRL